MFLGEVFERFAGQSPVGVMARAAFEHALSADVVDALFEEYAQPQYTRDLLFSQVVDLMALVVCKVRPSLNAAIQKRTDLMVTRKAVYAKTGGHFVVRRHGSNLSVRGSSPAVGCVRTPTGAVSEGALRVGDGDGAEMIVRRVTITRDTATRDATAQIHILTDLPAEVPAAMIAEVYRGRWRIEGAFHEREAAIGGEVETLGYPKAARLALGVALVAFNVLQVVGAAIGAGHGIDAGPRCPDRTSPKRSRAPRGQW